MKLLFAFILCLSLLISLHCKKKAHCGCSSNEPGEDLPVSGGEIFYDDNNSRWVIFTMPNRGAAYYYYPCNADQDSLKAILQGAGQNETFIVGFSGTVKAPCSDEKFEQPNPSFFSSFHYIVLDSLRRY